MRILVIGDSDSYVKWGAALASRLPHAWQRELVILRSPVQPSPRQLAAALADTVFDPGAATELQLESLPAHVAETRPDVVLAAVRGPVVRVVARSVQRARGWRPVFVTGLPGITIPAARKAIVYRAHADLVVLHSRREVRDFTALAAEMGLAQRFGLSTLPFVPERPPPGLPGGDIVFAAQAIVPRPLDERMLLLGRLAECARRHPDRRVVVKVRAAPGEAQTHAEEHDYTTLMASLRPPAPPNLVVEAGPMSRHLARAGALVTVSSTAAVEAVAAGIPVLLIDDFGVAPHLINTVFEGSGLLGGSHDLIDARFRLAEPGWAADNYLHGREHDDWLERVEALVRLRDAGELPWRMPRERVVGGALRHAWDRRRALGEHDRSLAGTVAAAVGTPARWAVRRLRRIARAVRGAGAAASVVAESSRGELARRLP